MWNIRIVKENYKESHMRPISYFIENKIILAYSTIALVGILQLSPSYLLAQAPGTEMPKKGEEVLKLYEKNKELYADNPNIMARSGLVADNEKGIVEVVGESTGLSSGDTAEFLIIATNSAHRYEALLWAHAKPSDVHAAMEFIELRAGAPFNPRKLRYQAKGDRVKVSIRFEDNETARIEKLITDTGTDSTLTEEGFVFGGSFKTDKGEYGADIYEPHAVVSMFNTPVTVLDVPRQASQDQVYQSHTINGEYALAANSLVTIIFEAETGRGEDAGVEELTLTVSAREPDANNPENLSFKLTTPKGTQKGKEETLNSVIGQLRILGDMGKDAYITINFMPDVPLSDIKKVASFMLLLEKSESVNIEPPEDGQLYYRAFMPNEQWSDREKRFRQPWELHLSNDAGAIKGKMVRHEPNWKPGASKPEFNTVSHDVASGKELSEKIKAYKPPEKEKISYDSMDVLLIFTEGEVTHGELMSFLSAVSDTHGTIHVFLE